MPTVVVSRRALMDFERFAEHGGDAGIGEVMELIFGALDGLRLHPYLGRPVRKGPRGLIISHGATGFVALYEYRRARDEVVVHALRHQREAGSEPE